MTYAVVTMATLVATTMAITMATAMSTTAVAITMAFITLIINFHELHFCGGGLFCDHLRSIKRVDSQQLPQRNLVRILGDTALPHWDKRIDSTNGCFSFVNQ